jgi:5-methylcytosine-specific restriction endonuclease McrA
MEDWRSKVYRPIELEDLPEDWSKQRQRVFYRDRYKCLRCDKRFSSIRLNAHHLIPREDGGSHDEANLVTLCTPCHNFIEGLGIRTRVEIIASAEQGIDAANLKKGGPIKDWHTWVYGGKRNPRL